MSIHIRNEYEHPAALIELDGVPFFVDSVGPLDDMHVGQMLCGAAFCAGQAVAWREMLLGAARAAGDRPLGRLE